MRPVAVIWSSVLHVVLLVAVIVGLPWTFERPRPAIVAAPIQGTIVDQAAIERERKKQEDAARQERLQQQREDRARREAAEQQHLAEQRVVAEQHARDDAKRKEEQRLADERAEQQRKKQEAEAQARRDREERAAQKRREEEIQLAAAAEAEANAARAAGLQDQYMLMIENAVKREWQRPLSARPGTECVVNVVQLPTGDVVSATVDPRRCNGDDAVRRSIENAVHEASPLPRPPTQAVFSRTFTLTFAPDK
jgi:colicin import membrane protein